MAGTQVALLLLVIGPLSCVCLYWDNPTGTICKSQSDCLRNQCCVNSQQGATSGVCENRKRTGASCHNPRSTGFHHVWCPGPAGIIHPDLIPCGCGEFCAMGPNPRQNSQGGYIDCHTQDQRFSHHVRCPGHSGIIHPDLCPCGFGDFCPMGSNPKP